MSPTIGIYSPGDMGHTVAHVLKTNSLRVVTCLNGRSERTRNLAAQAEIEIVPDYETLVLQSDLLLSILVPSHAVEAAKRVAEAVESTGADLTYVDCNAIAPQTTREIEQIVVTTGARYVDASIVGPPPRKPGNTRFYTSGEHAAEFAVLNDYGLDVRVLSAEIGHASAIKMCYGGFTKGFTALYTNLLTAAHEMGVLDALLAEYQTSLPEFFPIMERGAPRVPRKARRFVGEMEEVASTLEALGLTPLIHRGAADMYRFLGETPLAKIDPEDPTPPPPLAEALAIFATQLAVKHGKEED